MGKHSIGFRLSAIAAACLIVTVSGASQGQPPAHRDVRPHASAEAVRFVHSTGAFSLEHPANWQAHERGDRTNIGAPDGLERTERGIRTIYGVIVATIDSPVPPDSSLEQAAQAIVKAILDRNTHQRLQTPVRSDATLAGAPAATAVLMGTSPATGRLERAEIVTRRLGSSRLLYLILVSPADAYDTLAPAFTALRASLRIPADSKEHHDANRPES